MKKKGCLMSMAMLFSWMLLAACAPMQKTLIMNSNLPTLKGKWSGWTTFTGYQANSLMTTLEITNDAVPVEGKMIIHNFPGPVRRAFDIPLKDVSADNSVTFYFQNGKITDSGTLLGTNGQNFCEFTYYGERQRLDGRFYFHGAAGAMEFTKN
jgi:hypothetical protein